VTKVHLVGICGTAMATLAAMLKAKGLDVRGSDQGIYPPMSDFLAVQGITLLEGYRAEHITADLDLVVVGNAISRGNPEVEEVLDRKIRYCSLPEAVRDQFLWAARSIVVAGTHGKTTTTSLAGWLLTHGGLDPSVFIGGIAENFESSFRLGGGRDFVIEGDEYDSAFFDKTAKFLKYVPDIVVIANIEFDHADIYPDLEAVRLAFRRLVNLVPRHGLLLLGADNAEAAALAPLARCPVETYGLSEDVDWHAHGVTTDPTGTSFQVRRRGAGFGTFALPMLGLHNVRNALAAIAIGHHLGLEPVGLADGLARFRGVRRRLEHRGTVGGVDVYDDFAHHPTAVDETLRALRARHPGGKLWAVFEPRSATACRALHQHEYVAAFRAADRVLFAPLGRTNVPEAERLDLSRLASEIGDKAVAAASVDAIIERILEEAKPGDTVALLSNGAFGGIHARLLGELAERKHA